MDSQALELAPLLARRELWLLVSAGFVDPYHHQRFELLRNSQFRRRVIQAAGLLAGENSSIDLGPGELAPRALSPQDLFAALDGQTNEVEAAYRRLFGLTAVSSHCPSCEVEYEPNADVTYRSQQFADVAGFYQAFGLDVSTGAGERLDHITVESEFIYVLLAKEAAALAAENSEGAEICREARKKFFQEHLGCWLPAFARILSRVAPPGFYRELARLTAAVSGLERASLGLPPTRLPERPRPPAAVAEATCFSCAGNSDASSGSTFDHRLAEESPKKRLVVLG